MCERVRVRVRVREIKKDIQYEREQILGGNRRIRIYAEVLVWLYVRMHTHYFSICIQRLSNGVIVMWSVLKRTPNNIANQSKRLCRADWGSTTLNRLGFSLNRPHKQIKRSDPLPLCTHRLTLLPTGLLSTTSTPFSPRSPSLYLSTGLPVCKHTGALQIPMSSC